MNTISNQNFGFLIAYLLPGSVALYGVSLHVETVANWLATATTRQPTVGGFLYGTLAALALGVFINTLRLFTIDNLHQLTGVQKYDWNYRVLQSNVGAVQFMIENQFRYHQFHGNTVIALACAYLAWEAETPNYSFTWLAVFLVIEAILIAGSRRCLKMYYLRLNSILESV